MHDVGALTTARPWLVLPIESKVRELNSRIFLAAVAAERGFGSVIVRQADLPRLLALLPPSVVLQMNAISTEVFDLARRRGHSVTSLDEEGLVYSNRDDYLRRRISVAALEAGERFFAWGEVHRDAVASKAPGLEDRIVATGSPRMDLLRPEIRDVYRHEADLLTERFGRFILINTNFASFNHRLGPDHVAELWDANGWTATSESVDLLRRTQDFKRRMLDEFVALTHDLTDALPPDVRLVVRPHPAERHETWHERVGHIENIDVIYEGGIVPWLLATEAIVHNSCTTGIEAVLMDRPSFAYVPVRDDAVEQSLPNRVSRQIADRGDLVDAIVESVKNEIRQGLRASADDTLARNIAQLEGRFASDVIVDHFEAVSRPAAPIGKPSSVPARMRWGRFVLRARSFGSALRRRRLSEEKAMAGFVQTTSSTIGVHEVQDMVARVAAASGRFPNVRAHEIASDVVVVGEPS